MTSRAAQMARLGHDGRSHGAAIEVEGLAKTYRGGGGDVVAVDGISFEVAEAEIFGLLGPNGAGKTTTVHMLATLLRPSGGTAGIAGRDLWTQAPAIRREIGVALQQTGLDDTQTGRQLLELIGRLHRFHRRDARRRAKELLELVGLSDAADRRIRTYSGGMRRRIDLALALALVHHPRLLYLDEPTTGLDPAARRDVWAEIEALRAAGITILLTTQYLEEADRLADRVAIMDAGAIVADGTPRGAEAPRGRRRDRDRDARSRRRGGRGGRARRWRLGRGRSPAADDARRRRPDPPGGGGASAARPGVRGALARPADARRRVPRAHRPSPAEIERRRRARYRGCSVASPPPLASPPSCSPGAPGWRGA